MAITEGVTDGVLLPMDDIVSLCSEQVKDHAYSTLIGVDLHPTDLSKRDKSAQTRDVYIAMT